MNQGASKFTHSKGVPLIGTFFAVLFHFATETKWGIKAIMQPVIFAPCSLSSQWQRYVRLCAFRGSPMETKQTRIVIGVIALALLACLFSPLLSSREPILPLYQTALSFNATNAFQAANEFVTEYPRRVIGSFESRQSTGYLRDYLEKLGYAVEYSHFDARVPKREVGRNVLVFKKGQDSEIVAVVAHYDTARTTLQGAMKNGAAVGVLLELARIFAASPTRRNLLFIFSDGGEWGTLGAQDLAQNYPERNRMVAVLSLDHVCIGDLAAFRLEETGQLKGFTPPWLRQIVRHAAEIQGLPVASPSGFLEHFERAMLISRADQGPFLKADIPAINLGSASSDPIREKAVYHSPQDATGNLSVSSIEKYGLVAERIVRSLDGLPSIPVESSGHFRLWDALFLRPGTVSALHATIFVPLPVIFYFYFRNHCGRMNLALFGRELLVFSGTIAPLWILYPTIALLRGLRLLPFYSLYPAPAKDPVLENPPWDLLGWLFATAVVAGVICYVIVRVSLRHLPKSQFHGSKMILLGFMLIIVAFALCHNTYWASAFLLLPVWIWALAGPAQGMGERVRNGILLFAAGIPCYAALFLNASQVEMSWNFVWYQVLALSTGLYSAAGFFLGTAAIALGIRFVAIQFCNK